MYIDHRRRTAIVYTSVEQGRTLRETDSLDSGDVLPGFRLPLGKLFAELKL
jgi:hypothetical protein